MFQLAFGMPSLPEMIVIGIVAVLLFGRRLPEVGRSLGKGIVEFKKGLKGIEEDIEEGERNRNAAAAQNPALPGHKFDPYTGKPLSTPETAGHKFDPYTGKPLDQNREPGTTPSPMREEGTGNREQSEQHA